MNKKISNYIAVFDYFVKTLLVLSAASGRDIAASFATIIASVSYWNS